MADFAVASRRGLHKYGTTTFDNPLSLHSWLTHAYEESRDRTVYLKRAILELERHFPELCKEPTP